MDSGAGARARCGVRQSRGREGHWWGIYSWAEGESGGVGGDLEIGLVRGGEPGTEGSVSGTSTRGVMFRGRRNITDNQVATILSMGQ